MHQCGFVWVCCKKKRRSKLRTQRQRESNLWACSLMSFLTRFTDGGKSSIRKIVPLFFPSPPSANGPIVTRSSADTTHPLFHHPIRATITWTDSPTHYSLTNGTVTFQEAFQRNWITSEHILCQIVALFFYRCFIAVLLCIMSFTIKEIIEQQA